MVLFLLYILPSSTIMCRSKRSGKLFSQPLTILWLFNKHRSSLRDANSRGLVDCSKEKKIPVSIKESLYLEGIPSACLATSSAILASSPSSSRPSSKTLSKSYSPHLISGFKPANFHMPSTFLYQCWLEE